ncbi:hypothetical protein B0I75DRAFT_25846 [Yarrowia lipolytica]|uniref:Uncharacterized protein n=1 Tax=Yarrowia lipolytica TaxID=4952 RepID=A0A371CC73_YARLL|nr:hypothetical protein B0I71DRAFT_13264 [Yarrowia lipolytica]RDW46934.1 hypothetical protein B0I74DRAFT_22428 [Yarrowia lipolytica]RDW53108.1 hypothetical protein B0I75DRAFT_25846 [Yarrowia lipolytica]
MCLFCQFSPIFPYFPPIFAYFCYFCHFAIFAYFPLPFPISPSHVAPLKYFLLVRFRSGVTGEKGAKRVKRTKRTKLTHPQPSTTLPRPPTTLYHHHNHHNHHNHSHSQLQLQGNQLPFWDVRLLDSQWLLGGGGGIMGLDGAINATGATWSTAQ